MKIINLPCGCHRLDSDGSVYSNIVQFSIKGKRGRQTEKTNKWKKLDCTLTKKGYLQTAIHGRIIRVNRLIALNFIPNPFAYSEVHHKDDIKIMRQKLLLLSLKNVSPYHQIPR